jgi:hypothetical protein
MGRIYYRRKARLALKITQKFTFLQSQTKASKEFRSIVSLQSRNVLEMNKKEKDYFIPNNDSSNLK